MAEVSRQVTLAENGLETIALFKKVRKINNAIENNSEDEWPKALFAAEADRFDLWAVNLGLFVSGHGSLDYRIREAESLERTLRRFIQDLNDSLIEVLEYCTGVTPQTDNAVQDDSSRRPFDEFLDENFEEDTDQEPESDIDLLVDSVRDPIDRLYKLSTRIRNPSSRLGSSKALHHQQFDQETGVDLLRVIEDFDYDHVSSLVLQYRKQKAIEEYQTCEPYEDEDEDEDEDKDEDEDENDDANHVWEPIRTVLSQYHGELLNGTESFIVRRIARANVRRRQQFSYWKQHRDKLARHTSNFTQKIEADEGTTPDLVDIEKRFDQLVMPMVAPLQSVTTASRLNLSQLVDTENRSTVSVSEYAPSMWRPGKETVVFPSAPKCDRSDKFFECPYCFTLCATELLNEKAWKAHLLHDLRPYTCTYEDCRNADQLYDSRKDWIQHENSMHRRIWRCPEHPAHVYTDREEYRRHLHNVHADFSNETLENQLIHGAETSLASADRCCPICSQALETAKSLHNHIALHLERFAIFALPRSVDHDDDDSDDVGSDKANVAVEGSREDDFESDADVAGEYDFASSAAGIARQRWKVVLERVIEDLRSQRPIYFYHASPFYQAARTLLRSLQPPKTSGKARFYDPDEDARILAKALKGSARRPDIDPLIDILPRLTRAEVFDLRVEYMKIVQTGAEHKGVNIAKHIKLRLKDENPSLMRLCYTCALGQWESEAYWVNVWYQKPKNRRQLLIESLFGRPNGEIRAIKDNFHNINYRNNLTKCLRTELIEDSFKKTVMVMLEEKRMLEGPIDRFLVVEHVKAMYQAVNSKPVEEGKIVATVVSGSDGHLREVLGLYESTHGTNLAREVVKKCENKVGETLAHILDGVINKPLRDAILVHFALSDFASDNSSTDLLISRLVRYHWDRPRMEAIKKEYSVKYGVDMEKAVADGTKGDWGRFCERLCYTW